MEAAGSTGVDIDEDERLAALRRYGILDTDPEPLFDDIARLAASICGTPIAAVSFIDRDRQWFKAAVGTEVRVVPRDIAFCAHAILTPDRTMVVPDATADARFADNPLVVNDDPGVRFYAGTPLVTTSGAALGTICALDRRPHSLTEEQRVALEALSRQVVALLEARAAVAHLHAADEARTRAEAEAEVARVRFRQVFEAAPIGMAIADARGVLVNVNAAYCALLGAPVEAVVGRHAREFIVAEQGALEAQLAGRLRDGQGSDVREVVHRRIDGRLVPSMVTTSVIRDASGTVMAHLAQVESIAQRREAENLLLEAQSAVDAIISMDGAGLVVAWNTGAERMFGRSRSEMIGKPLTAVMPERLRAGHAAGLARVRGGGESRLLGGTVELAALRKDGSEFPVELSLSAWQQGGTPYYTGILRDITERVAAEAQRRLAESRAALLGAAALAVNESETLEQATAALLDAVCEATGWQGGHAWMVERGRLHPTGVWRLDDPVRTRRFRELTERILLASGEGLPGAVLASGKPALVSDLRDDDAHPRRRTAVACGITAGLAVPILAGNEVAGVLEFFLPTAAGPPDDEWVSVLEQVGAQLGRAVERQRAERELTRRATRDPLTGLANRTLMLDHLETAILEADRQDTTAAVLFCDLDRFKVVNDSLGHAAGDRLLGLVAERLATVLRPSDLLARPGGDEFVVVCQDLPDAESAGRVAERVLAGLQAPFPLLGQDVVVATSIGVATTTGSATAEELLRYADLAMYRAKEQGNGYALFDERLREHILRRLSTESGLRRALAADELRVHFQPVVALATGRLASVEALVRWERPGQETIPPAEFIPLAEDTGLIVPLGEHVLRAACLQAAEWSRAHPALGALGMAVNLSARQLHHPALMSMISDALDAAGLAPSRLTLELTESVLAQDAELTVELLTRIKQLGVRIAIDDFGTGYSSLAYLRSFPVDVLKIDKRFVDQLGVSADDDAVIEAVIRLAQALRLDVVAEGVETAEQAALLTALGCTYGQGYHFARPAAADRIPAWAATASR